MSTTRIDIAPETERTRSRFGYGVAIAVNVVMLLIVQNVVEWDWLPFLTDGFESVAPWISFSLVVTIAGNLVYRVNDTQIVKSAGQILINLISIAVSYQILHVFPFDFSEYGFNWALLTRIVLILAMIGAGIGALTEVLKLTSVTPGMKTR